jgi:hypothetical protein
MHQSYIVITKPKASESLILELEEMILKEEGTIQHRYEHVITGFSALFPKSLLPRIISHPGVLRVEEDHIMFACD